METISEKEILPPEAQVSAVIAGHDLVARCGACQQEVVIRDLGSRSLFGPNMNGSDPCDHLVDYLTGKLGAVYGELTGILKHKCRQALLELWGIEEEQEIRVKLPGTTEKDFRFWQKHYGYPAGESSSD